MMTIEKFKELAMSFPGTEELPHFEKMSFRVKKKIFAALADESKTATLKFNEEDQAFFCSKYEKAFHPVNGKWGKQGWTFVNLKSVQDNVLKKALRISYDNVLKKRQQVKL